MGVDSYKGQSYDKLRKELLKSGQLFRDSEFPPSQKSLFYSRTDEEIVWKRPTELCNVPRLVIDGTTCDDLIEGELGNRWFVTACSSLANHKQLFSKVVPDAPSQDYNMQRYTGMFRFQLWLYGQWTEVVVDDFLPTRHGKLIFCHSKSKNEFWSALLEKAYAKLFGDYERMSAGQSVDALVDFTGGVAERRDITTCNGEDENDCLLVYKWMEEALANRGLVVAEVKEEDGSVPHPSETDGTTIGVPEGTDVLIIDSPTFDGSPPHTQASAATGSPSKTPKTGYFRSNSIVRDGFVMDCGLLSSHGYNVREVTRVSLRKGTSLCMVRVQSPWQTGEWRGAWSNQSAEMKGLSVKEKTKLGLKFEAESEFWMLLADFLANFTNISICNFVNTSSLSLRKTWTESVISGRWVSAGTEDNDRAGGSVKHPTFFRNPQYMFDITAPSSESDGQLMVCLEQNDRTLEKRGQRNPKNLCIGFNIMKVEENRKYRLHRMQTEAGSVPYSSNRSVFYKTPLHRGRYVIIPSTTSPGENGDFLLRLYNSSSNMARELERDEPPKPSLICCTAAPCLAVQLTVIGAEGLATEKSGVVLNPYCVIKCEGETCKTSVIRATSSPTWNTTYLFYKKTTPSHKDYPITIQVLSSQALKDLSLGEAVLRDLADADGTSQELSLYQRTKKKDQADIALPGKLCVKVYSSEDLSEF